ncbi:MAG: transglycosylase SLT domain-containing protein [Pseudomonadota bacterium]
MHFYLIFTIILLLPIQALQADTWHNKQLFAKERAQYLSAKAALDNGRLVQYQKLRQQLGDYPLAPYLDYQFLRKRLASLPYTEVDIFLEQNQDSYLGKLLLRRWLSLLAAKNHWHDYRSYYEDSIQSTAHQCLYLWSKYNTGEKSIIAEVVTLWNVEKSQPDECDPLFKQWKDSGYLSQDLLWERYQKALLANTRRLIPFLRKKMSPALQSSALTFEKVLNNPALVNNTKSLLKNPKGKDIFYHGLIRYIRSNSDGAFDLWQKNYSRFDYTEKEQQYFYYRLARRYAFDARPADVRRLLPAINPEVSTKIIEALIRELLAQKNWIAVQEWIGQLPQKDKATDRWRYWLARSQEQLKPDTAKMTFQQLATSRSYYGFLSADLIQKPYSFEDTPSVIPDYIMQRLQKIPALARARELFYLKKLHDARQEWKTVIASVKTLQLPPDVDRQIYYQGLAQISYRWSWYRKSIESMAAAQSWDDLRIRFPVAHKQTVLQLATQTKLPATLIFAIARQESAWESDARSSAGAVGLMQLMPGTARETARKAGISHSKQDLLIPRHNMLLGSRYISELLNQYNQNRLPAIAAYNAGPHRVNRWLRETGSRLPHDVWVEVIPFPETRKYVQNVLSYSLVYSKRMGIEAELLTSQERGGLL